MGFNNTQTTNRFRVNEKPVKPSASLYNDNWITEKSYRLASNGSVAAWRGFNFLLLVWLNAFVFVVKHLRWDHCIQFAYVGALTAILTSVSLLLISSGTIAESRSRCISLSIVSKRFCRKHSWKMSRMGSTGRYCWSAFFRAKFPEVIFAFGPTIRTVDLRYLLTHFGTHTDFCYNNKLAVHGSHVFKNAPLSFQGTFDKSLTVGSPQEIVDVATSVNSASLGVAYATETFRQAISKSLVVSTALTKSQRKEVEREIDFPCIFRNTNPVASDHATVAALRELARQVYERVYKIRDISVSTLAIGATANEFTKYAANKCVDFFFAGMEGKDYNRAIRPLLEEIATTFKKKIRGRSKNTTKARSKLVDDVSSLLAEYKEITATDTRIKLEHDEKKYEALLFEDSFYNFGPSEFRDTFRTTGANVAYGYGLLPLELVWPTMPQSSLYKMYRAGADVTLAFDYCNGYTHNEEKWSTLLKHPVMNFHDFSLFVEISCYAGPMAVFSMTRVVASTEKVSRVIALPKRKQYVRMRDLMSKRASKTYISMFADEFFEVYNYCLAIDDKSLTFANTLNFIRRRAGGVSLVSKELLAPWHLSSRDFSTAAFTIYVYAKNRKNQAVDIEAALGVGQFTGYRAWFNIPWDTRYKTEIEELVIFQNSEMRQRETAILANPAAIKYAITLVDDYDEKAVSDCFVCNTLSGALGDQVLKCDHKADSSVEVVMTQPEVDELRARFADDDNDPQGLAKVKKRAADAMVKGAFSTTVNMHYIRGGPGCGKSFIIRKLATSFDLVYAPFSRLMADYRNLSDAEGEFYNLPFATNHRGIEARGVSIIYLDEFTSMPYEYLKLVIGANAPTDVFLVGDHKQTTVRAHEGQYIGDFVDLASLSTHELLSNFRNPVDTVELLNRNFGYKMEAKSAQKKSIYVTAATADRPAELTGIKFHELAFTYSTLKSKSLEKTQTVRKYQGSTVDHVRLHIDESIEGVSDSLVIVAFSRHKCTLWITYDDGPHATAFLAKYGLLDAEIPTDKVVFNQPPKLAIVKDPEMIRLEQVHAGYEDAVLVTHEFSTLEAFCSFLNLRTVAYITLVFAMNLCFEYAQDRISYSLLVLTLLTSKLLLIRHAVYIVESCPAGTDYLLLAFFSAFRYFYGGDGFKPLHFYIPSIDAFLSFGLHCVPFCFFMGAKINYISRIFSYDGFQGHYKVIITLMGALITKLVAFSFGYEHFCDLLAHPSLIVLVAYARYKGFRFGLSFPFFSYDQVAPLPKPTGAYDTATKKPVTLDGTQEYKDVFTHYSPYPTEGAHAPAPVPEPGFKTPKVQAGMDSYLLAQEFVAAVGTVDTCDSFNNIGSTVCDPNLKTGTLSVSDYLCPRNARGNSKSMLSQYYQFFPGAGNFFSSRSVPQLLQVLCGRYFNRKPKPKAFDNAGKLLAREIVREFFSECMNDLKFSPSDLDMVANEFACSAREKKYDKMFKGFDNMDVSVVRFHLKSIMKPKVEDFPNPEKCGQGISAWDKDLQVMFGTGARYANYCLLAGTKPNVVYDNRLTTVQMREKVTTLIANTPTTSLNGVTDFSMFDSYQDEFTQQIEKEFMYQLGFSELFVEHYYMFRKEYTLMSSCAKGKCSFEKTSGEPMTLLMNSVISACLSNYLLRGDGPWCFVFKGDDGFKRQANLQVDPTRKETVSAYLTTSMTTAIGKSADFCGFTICEGAFVESIPRKLTKLLTHRFSSYKHFCQYQQTLLDYVSQMEDDFFFPLYVACNAKAYREKGITIADVNVMFDIIKSFSHINETQFRSLATLVEVEPIQPSSTGFVLGKFSSSPVGGTDLKTRTEVAATK